MFYMFTITSMTQCLLYLLMVCRFLSIVLRFTRETILRVMKFLFAVLRLYIRVFAILHDITSSINTYLPDVGCHPFIYRPQLYKRRFSMLH